MNNKTILKTSLIFSIIGVLFSGYLTISKLVLGVCPLKESCPFLFNYPVCLYGLIMFVTLLLATITLLYIDAKDKLAQQVLKYISILGILFSTYYIYQEIFVLTCPGGCVYSLGIPTCIYGLVMYIVSTICAWCYKN
jgi:uncharacterized membrane protein